MSDPSQLWTECVQWLIRCQILDQSHRVTNKHAEIVDFAQTLRDGVLLCQLASRLCKGSIDLREVNWRPQLSQVSQIVRFCFMYVHRTYHLTLRESFSTRSCFTSFHFYFKNFRPASMLSWSVSFLPLEGLLLSGEFI